MTITRTFHRDPAAAAAARHRYLDQLPTFALLDPSPHPRDVRGDEIDRLGIAGDNDAYYDGDDAA